jgi:3-dehydroquinate dehydratase-2
VPKKPAILVLNGPNLNTLGRREPELYGHETLDDVAAKCREKAREFGWTLQFKQSNSESELVGWIQAARDSARGIVINPAAFTHTSVAVLDALLYAELPVIEVHISNIFRREAFRHHSYVSRGATGVICGLGTHGYVLAMDAMREILERGDGG